MKAILLKFRNPFQKGSFSLESLLLVFVIVCLLILIVAPAIMLLYGAFFSRTEGGFTLEHFQILMEYRYLKPVLNTFEIAGLTTFFAFLFGFPIGFLVARTNLPSSRLVEMLSISPLYLNPLAGAIGWILLGSPRIGIANKLIPIFNIYTPLGMGLSMGVFYSPYFFFFLSSALKSMDPELEEASWMLGASESYTVRHVTLPLITPAIISATLLVFVLAASMFSIPLLLGFTVRYDVMSTTIFGLLAYPPTKYGEATVLSLFLLVFAIVATFLLRKKLDPAKYVTIRGKGYRPRKMDIGRWRYPTLTIVLLVQFLFFVLPVLLVVLSSFSTSWTRFEFTLENYIQIFMGQWSDYFWRAFRNSLFVSVVGASLAMLLAITISHISIRTKLRGRGIPDYISSFSLAIPGVVMAVGLIWFWLNVPFPMYGTIWILILACVGKFVAYGVRSVTSSMLQVSPELEECGKLCGASLLKTFKDITIPLVKPGFFSGWVLLFVVFFREAAMMVLLYTYQTITLSVLLIDMFDNVVFTIFCAVGVAQMATIWIIVLLFSKLFGIQVKMVEA